MKFVLSLLALLTVFAAAPASAQDDPFAGLTSDSVKGAVSAHGEGTAWQGSAASQASGGGEA